MCVHDFRATITRTYSEYENTRNRCESGANLSGMGRHPESCGTNQAEPWAYVPGDKTELKNNLEPSVQD